MPIVNIPNYGPVSFPDNMSPDEVKARTQNIEETVAKQFDYQPDYRNMGLGQIFSGGLHRSLSGLGTAVTDVLPAMVGSALGYDEYAKKKLADAAASQAETEAQYPTAYKSFKDIGSLGNVVGYGAEALGGLATDIAAMFTGAGAGAAIGKRVALGGIERLAAERLAAGQVAKEGAVERLAGQVVPGAKEVGSNVGMFGSSLATTAPNTFQDIYNKTGELDPGIATAFGAGQAILNTVIPHKILSQFSPAARDAVTKTLVNQASDEIIPPTIKAGMAKSMLATGAEAAAAGGAQELLGVLAAHTAGEQGNIFSQDNLDRYMDAALKGAIGGATLGAPGAFAQASHAKRAAQAELAKRAESPAPVETPPAAETPATPAPALSSTIPPEQLAAALKEVTAPTEPTTPATPINPQFVDMVSKWNDKNLQSTLEFQQAKPPEGQNKPLIAAIEAEIAKRNPAQGAENVVPNTAETGQPEVPVTPPVGESVGVVSEPGGAAAPGGVGVSEPAGVVSTGVPPVRPDVREGSVPPALEEAKPEAVKPETPPVEPPVAPPVEPPVAPPVKPPVAPTATPGNLEALHKDMVDIVKQKQTLLTPAGRTPFKNSPARAKFDVLDAQLQKKKDAWKAATGEDVNVQSLLAGKFEAPKTEAPVAPIATPEAPKTEAPVTPAKPKRTAEEMLARAEEAQRKADEAAKVEVKPEAEAPVEKPVEAPTEPKAEKPAFNKVKQDELKRQRVAERKAVTDRFQEVAGGGYEANKHLRDNVSAKDEEVVHNLITTKEGKTKEGKDAEAYFSKVPHLVDALHNIAFDLVNEVPHFRATDERAIEADFHDRTGGKSAEAARDWVKKNLGTTANEQFQKFIDKETKIANNSKKTLEEHENTDVQRAKYNKAMQEQLAKEAKDAKRDALKEARQEGAVVETQKELGPDSADIELENWLQSKDNRLFSGEVSPFAAPVHPVVRQALSDGKLQQALKLMAQNNDKGTRELANTLAKVAGDTHVKTIHELKDASGKRVPGYYDPTTNTVYLDSEAGMNTHTVFHEVSHAATSHVLDNPSHPVTKQLNQLFNEVKDSLDTAYGAQSLHEFVAETWSNDEFKAKLNSMNANGSPISAWQKFVHTIRNLFRALVGKETVPYESAYTVADKAIKSILSPAPNYRDGTALYAAVLNPRDPKISSWLDEGVNALEKLPGMTPERANAVHAFVRKAGRIARDMLFSVMPTDIMGDIAKKYLPNAPRVHAIIDMMRGDEQRRNQSLESADIANYRWAKSANAEVVKRFNELGPNTSLDQIDPTRPRQFYVDKFAKDPKEQAEALAKWDKYSKELNALEAISPGAIRTYNRIKNEYGALRAEIIASMKGKVDEIFTNQEVRDQFKNELLQKITSKGEIDPYFPLTREGDFWLSYNAPSEGGTFEHHIEAFTGERERERRLKNLEEAGATELQKFAKISEINYKNVPNSSFVHGVLKLMELNRPKDAALAKNYDESMEQITRMYLMTMPETSFAKSFAARVDGGVLGFKGDTIGVFRQKAFNISRQLTNMKYSAMLNKERATMLEYVKELGKSGKVEDNQLAKEYYDQMSKRVEFAKAPRTSKSANFINGISFNYLLGFNVSSALVNMLQVPMIVMPHLGGKYGYGATGNAIANASKAFMSSGFGRDVKTLAGESISRRAMLSMDNIDFNAKNVPENLKKYQTLVEYGREMGQFNRSQLSDTMGTEGDVSAMARVNAISGAAMHHGERMNREVSMMAAYDLELQRMNSSEATAVEKALTKENKERLAAERAVYTADFANGGTAAAAAPPIAQHALGRVLWMFKGYGVKMNYLLFKTAKEALEGESPEIRKAAFKQLAGTIGTTALISGLQGLPLFGTAAMLYNMFKDDDDEDFGAVVRGHTGERIYTGLLNNMTNLAVAERAGLTNLIFRDSPQSSGSATVVDNLAQTFGGPALGVITKVARGIQQMRDGQMERGIENIVPGAIGNVMKANRFATEGANTLRGDPIVGDVTPWNVGAQALGFTPAEYQKELEITALTKGIEKTIVKDRTKYLNQLNIAERQGDSDMVQQAYDQLQHIYAKHPELGNLNKTIEGSHKSFVNAKVVNGALLPANKNMANAILNIRGEQEAE